jgi:tripartite-type tricarboxylate transporter receptor subunit TctC
VIGSTGAGSASVQLPAFYNNILGTKFKIIFGYRSFGTVQLAMERGEVEGVGTGPWDAYKVTRPQWIRDGKMNVIVQVGLKKDPALPHVPLLRDQGNSPEEKALLEFISKSFAIGWPFAVGPGVPADRVKALRAAFAAVTGDPTLLAEAKRQKITIDPIPGLTLAALIDDIIKVPPDVRDRVNAAIRPPADARKIKGAKGGKKKKKKV